MRAGSDTEMTSGLARRRRARSSRTRPASPATPGTRSTSPELFVVVDHPLKRSGTPGERAAARRQRRSLQGAPERHDRRGARFEFGTNEIIAGRAAGRQFVGLTVGTTWSGESTWQLVGIFEDGGAVSESELWCDVKVLQPAYRRGNSYQSVYARLASPDSFGQLKDSLTPIRSSTYRPCARADYYGRRRETLQRIIRDDRRHHRRPDGHRRGLRRGQHDVHRGRQPDARDRHAARARVRHLPVVFSVLVEVGAAQHCRRRDRRRDRLAGFDGYQTVDDEFPVVQPDCVPVRGDPALLDRAVLRSSWDWSAASCRRSAPRGSRSSRRCANSSYCWVGCQVLTLIRSRIET